MTKPIRPLKQDVHAVVLVPSDNEWQELRHSYEDLRPGIALGREFLSRTFGRRRVVFVHTGEEKMEAAVTAQYAVDRWSPRVLASESGHEAYTHVATRNGLSLQPVAELNLHMVAITKAPDGDGAMPEVTTSGDVQTTDDITTTGDVATAADVETPDDDTAPDEVAAEHSIATSEPDDDPE